MPGTPDSRVALETFVSQLHLDYEVWYAKSVRRMYVSYYGLQLAVLFSSISTAVIAALADRQVFDAWAKVALIVIPSIGSLSAAVLHFFRIYDRWRLREDGRIKFQSLVIMGRRRLAAAKSLDQCSKIHEELHEAMTAIEQSQSDGFFGLSDGSAVTHLEMTKLQGGD